MENKKWWASKTVWVNLLAIIAVFVQGYTGKELLDSNTQLSIIALINLALRLITKDKVSL